MQTQKFRVVRYEFNPAAVGQERMLECMGKEVNIPISTNSTSKIVAKDLSESKAKTLRDKLNEKLDLSGNVEVIVGYRVTPMPRIGSL